MAGGHGLRARGEGESSAKWRRVAVRLTAPTAQFLASPSYPIAPGTSFQFAAFNFDYDAPGGIYADVVTDGYLAFSGIPVAPSNNITFSFKGAAVPEPAIWAMMIAGFGLIGVVLRSRRRTGVALA